MTLTCFYCHKPLVKKHTDAYDHRFDYVPGQRHAIERAFHRSCEPNYAPPDSPLNAAVQKAKQAIADAHRLSEREQEAFREIVGLALTEQRQ